MFQLDRRTQQPGCSQEGATLTFVTREGRVLAQKLTVRRGQRVVLTSLQPEPPKSGGATWFAVPHGLLAEARKIDVQFVDVYAGSARCGRLSLVDADPALDEFGDPMLRLEGACAQGGTTLTVIDDAGRRMFRRMVVTPGARVVLAGLGPEPPHTGGDEASPLPPAAGTGFGPGAQAGRVVLIGAALVVAVGGVVVFGRSGKGARPFRR